MSPALTRMPLAAPAWLTPTRIAVGTVVIGGMLASVPATALVLGLFRAAGLQSKLDLWVHTAELALPMMISTAALSLLCARRVMNSPTGGLFWNACLLGGLYGTLNPSIATGLRILFGAGETSPSIFVALITCVLAAIIFLLPSGILGVLFGAAYYIPLSSAVRAREEPAHDDAEQTLVRCGAWLATLAILISVLPYPGWFRLCAVLTAIAGLACFVAGIVCSRFRRAWIGAVASGQVAGFRIDSTARVGERALEALLPFHRGRGHGYSAVLLANAEQAPTPYRENAVIPVALVWRVDL